MTECLFLILARININRSAADEEGDLQCDGLTEPGIRLWELENTWILSCSVNHLVLGLAGLYSLK